MRSPHFSIVVLVTLLALASCATTGRLVHSWKDPTVKKLSFDRIVALAIVEDGPTRRLAESEMVRIIGPEAVPASQFVSDAELRDIDKVRARLTAEGFDGAITMRLIDATTKVRVAGDPVPTAYYDVWSYYGFVTIAEKGPAYLAADSKLQIETNIYSLKDGKLLWSGTSETLQPKLVETVVKEVAGLVQKRLRSEGLI